MTAAAGPAEPTVEMQEPPEEGQRFALLYALFDSKVTIGAVGFIILVLLLAAVGVLAAIILGARYDPTTTEQAPQHAQI